MLKMRILRVAAILVALALSGSALALQDDFMTVALWHMDSPGASVVADDDSYMTLRDNDLTLSGASIVAGGYDSTGSALSFNGAGNSASMDWPMCETVKIDMWIAADDPTPSSDQCLVDCPGMVMLYIDGTDDKLTFSVTDNEGTVSTIKASITNTTAFQHIVAVYNNHAEMSLETAEETVSTTTGTGEIAINSPESLYLGAAGGSSDYFAGKMDEVKISQELLTHPYTRDTFGLWHFDEQIGEGTGTDPNIARSTPHHIGGHDNFVHLNSNCYIDPFEGVHGGSYYADDQEVDGLVTHGRANHLWPTPTDYIEIRFWHKQAVIDNRYLLTMFPKNIRVNREKPGSGDPAQSIHCVRGVAYDSWGQKLVLDCPVTDQGNRWLYCRMRFVPKPGDPATTVFSVSTVSKHVEYPWMAYSSGKLYSSVPTQSNVAGNDVIVGAYERIETIHNPINGWIDELKISMPGAFQRCGWWGYHDGDLDSDCFVTMEDLSQMAQQWLDCTDVTQPDTCSNPDFVWAP